MATDEPSGSANTAAIVIGVVFAVLGVVSLIGLALAYRQHKIKLGIAAADTELVSPETQRFKPFFSEMSVGSD